MKTHDLREFDVVALSESIGPGLVRGTKGAVLMVHDHVNGIYEVEFVQENGESLGVATVSGRQLSFVCRPS